MPQLEGADYRVTSRSTPEYNCVAWAMAISSENWAPALSGPYQWPDHLPRVPLVSVMAKLFEERGYEPCADSSLEPDIEKIAIYGDAMVGEAVHVSRQLPTGRWTSKLGDLADIEHALPDTVAGGLYGEVQMVMARRTRDQPPVVQRVVRAPLLIVRQLRNWRGD